MYGDSSCFEVLVELGNPPTLDPPCEAFLGVLFDYLMTGAVSMRNNGTTNETTTSQGQGQGQGQGPGQGGLKAAGVGGGLVGSPINISTPTSTSSSSSSSSAVPLPVPVPLLQALAARHQPPGTSSSPLSLPLPLALPAATNHALRSLWSQFEYLTDDYNRRELLTLGRAMTPADQEKVDRHRRGRAWEMARCSKSNGERNITNMCDKVL